jgi:hypothetical protein
MDANRIRPWRLTVCCILIHALVLGPNLPLEALAAQSAPTRPVVSRQQAADRVGRLFKALKATVKEAPRDAFDPQALAAKLPKDPQAVFRWVRDNTRHVPYRGALRGPVGTLMDSGGNSLDRSLLLAELLLWSGLSVRLAHAELTPAQVDKLSIAAPSAPKAASAPASDPQAAIDAAAAKYKLSAKMLRDLQTAGAKASAARAAAVARRASDQAKVVLAAVKPPAQPAQIDALAKAALSDHWWVQYQDGDKWIDLDLLSAQAQGVVAGEPQTFALDKPDGKVHLDAKYCHEVEVRVVAEHLSGGKLSETTALKCSLRAADLAGSQLTLQHAPAGWPKDLDLSKENDPPARMLAQAQVQDEWVPILTVGEKNIEGSPVQMTLQAKRKGGGGMLGGIGGGLGALGGGDDEDDSASAGAELTAEWIEYVIRSPGADARTLRRPIFDIVGPAARAAGKPIELKLTPSQAQDRAAAMLETLDILIQTGRIAPEFVAAWSLGQVLAQRQAVEQALGSREFTQQDALEAMASLLPPSALLNLAMCRFSPRFGASDSRLTCPNILNRRCGPRLAGKGVAWRELIDIVNNEVTPAGGAGAFEAQVRQGVLDTVLEESLIAGGPADATPAFFTAAAAQGIAAAGIAAGDTAAFKSLGLPADVTARAQADLKEGYHLVAPAKPVAIGQSERYCWWRVRASTGETVGVVDTGFHQASGEYANTVRVSVAKALYRKAAAEAAKQAARRGFQFYNGWRAPAYMGSLCWDWSLITTFSVIGLQLAGAVGAVVWAFCGDEGSSSGLSSGRSGRDYGSDGWGNSSPGGGSSGTDAGAPSAGSGSDGNTGGNTGTGADAGVPSGGSGSDAPAGAAGSEAGAGAAGNNSNSGGNSGGSDSYYDDYDDW